MLAPPMARRTSRRRSLRLLAVGLLVASMAAVGCGESCSCESVPVGEAVTVYVVRHAEKEVVPDDADEAARRDPALSAAGQLRALDLPEHLPLEELDAIYVTRFARSEQTAAAVAAVTGLEPIRYPPKDYAGLIKRLRREAGTVSLVVGHSNTVPEILRALGVAQTVTVDEGQYGDLWVVQAKADGTAKLEVRRFGDAVGGSGN